MEQALYFCIRYSFKFALAGILLFLARRYFKYRDLVRRCKDIPTYNGLSWISYYNFMKKLTTKERIPGECYIFMFLNALCKLSENGLLQTWILHKRYIICSKAEVVRELICHPSVLRKPPEYVILKPYFGQGLITSNGDIWESHRKLLTPAFHLKIIKEYISIFNEQGSILARKLKEIANEPWIDISYCISACTLDIICETAMGVKSRCQEGDERGKVVASVIDECEDIATYRALRPWTQNEFLFRFSSTGRRMQSIIKEVKAVTDEPFFELLEEHELRKKADSTKGHVNSDVNSKSGSFGEILLTYKEENPSFTTQNIIDEVYTFISAGHDTSAMSLRWTLFLLGHHPDIQEILFEELDSILGGDMKRFITYQDLMNMTYLDCVIKESMRIYPPVPIVAREISEDVQVGKYKLPGGCTVAFNFYALHRDSEYFPEPEKFRPERFFPENIPDLHPFAYLPFSSGPRSCIGQKYALIELKVLLCHLLRTFRVKSLDHRDSINLIWGISLKNVETIRLRLIPRQP